MGTRISRRRLMQTLGGVSAVVALDDVSSANGDAPKQPGKQLASASQSTWDPMKIGTPLMRDPVWVYDNWSSYTDGFYKWLGLQDETRVSEQLAMAQLENLVRLARLGVHFDYYMMNAGWYAPDGAYRTWRRLDWPEGPDRWIAGCQEHGLRPGLWFGTNTAYWKIDVAPQWRDSVGQSKQTKSGRSYALLSMYEGGFLEDFMSAFEYWYERGVRLFELDFVDFDAATPRASKTQTPEEIRSRNRQALSDALKAFRGRHPDAMLVAFNDFGGDIFSTASPFPFKKPVDLRWLEVFDTLYTGDTRVSDVPLMSFWRSVDLFNDHMTRRYEQSGVPLERADPFFTLSSTWFGYHRGKRAWKSMLLLSMARGSWKKTIYGDLGVLSEEDARWFAKVQQLYAPLLAMGRTKSFGGIPGEVQPYGFGSFEPGGALYTVVNPTQAVRAVELPLLSRVQSPLGHGRILFRDAGFVAELRDAQLTLGPEQMATVGFGRYAQEEHDLGVEADVIVPQEIWSVPAQVRSNADNVIEATITAPDTADVRILVRQRAADGSAPRSPGLKIEAEQGGKSLQVRQPDQELAVSTGISWAAGEIRHNALVAGRPLTLRCTSAEQVAVTLDVSVYAVRERT